MKDQFNSRRPPKLRSKYLESEPSSGNVFADLGFEDSEERLLKAELATAIAQLIEKKGWTQAQPLSEQLWTNPKCHAFYVVSFPAFQPIDCSLF